MTARHVIDFSEISRGDVGTVGGKNASLGELLAALAPKGINVPEGFATTAEAFRQYLADNRLLEPIAGHLADYHAGKASLAEAGKAIRAAILGGEFPPEIEAVIRHAYRGMCATAGGDDLDVAVRSSATAEDLPEASFAGQQETFLNIRGEEDLIDACRRCYASLYTDRAISYREAQGYEHEAVALSVGVQRMIRSDEAGAGVMFSIDTENGFPDVVLINAAWGLGETVVQGSVSPDEYQVFKPLLDKPGLRPIVARECGSKESKLVYGEGSTTRLLDTTAEERASLVLSDDEIVQLARWAVEIEDHYGCAMDIEWAKDRPDGELYIVQARPETVQRKADAGSKVYTLTGAGAALAEGVAIGQAAAVGPACVIETAADIGKFRDGSILVTRTTDPDWVPIMKRAAAIVTDHGGRTSHAAIVSRELGLPAVVGTGSATSAIEDAQEVTVNCTEGERGYVHEGKAEIEVREVDLSKLPETRTKVMLNLANPSAAFRWWRLPADGVGLTRMEFVIGNAIKAHPMALLKWPDLADKDAAEEIGRLTEGYADKAVYFVDKLSLGLARIAAVEYPKPVIVRMSDFKTNEYAGLVGGAEFEPHEENPMIGFRGASRYYSERYRDGFALECRAIDRLRREMGFANVVVMIPFCRSVQEADKVLEVMAENGLERGRDGLEVYVMCEIPSNVVLAEAFAERFDGFSIGSNDLTQLTLGIDRDSELLAEQFDEQDEAVKWMIRHVIEAAHRHGARVGLCGQAPSDHPEFARFLVDCGIDSISVTPDSFVAVKEHVAAAESGSRAEPAKAMLEDAS